MPANAENDSRSGIGRGRRNDGPLVVVHLMMITIGDEIEIADRPIVDGESVQRSKVLK